MLRPSGPILPVCPLHLPHQGVMLSLVRLTRTTRHPGIGLSKKSPRRLTHDRSRAPKSLAARSGPLRFGHSIDVAPKTRINPRYFATAIQPSSGHQSANGAVSALVQEERDQLLRSKRGINTQEQENSMILEEPSSETLRALLSASTATMQASDRSSSLKLPSKMAVEFEDARLKLLHAKQPLSEFIKNSSTTRQFAIAALQVENFVLFEKLLKHIANGNWHLMKPATYLEIIPELLPANSNRRRQKLAFAFFNHHLRAHPEFKSAPMHIVALSFISHLAETQPVRALQLLRSHRAEISRVSLVRPEHAFEEALLELKLASHLPYVDVLNSHATKARKLAETLAEVDRKNALEKIAAQLVQGLLVANQVSLAIDVLSSKDLFDLSAANSDSTALFISTYRKVLDEIVQNGSVLEFERWLAFLDSLPDSTRSQLTQRERQELLLQVHAYAPNALRMTTEKAEEELAKMPSPGGRACNAFLRIAHLNLQQKYGISTNTNTSTRTNTNSKSTQPSIPVAEMEPLLSGLFAKHSFVPDVGTFSFLASLAQTAQETIDIFARASHVGHVGPELYAQVFRRVFTTGVVSDQSNFRLSNLIEQYIASSLPWTTSCLTSILAALNHHREWTKCWELFEEHRKAGDIRIDSNCANEAILAAQKLGSIQSHVLNNLFLSMEEAAARLYSSQDPSKKNSSLRLFASSGAKNVVSASSALETASSKYVDLNSLDDNIHPWMVLNRRTFGLVAKSHGYQAAFYHRMTSAPFNIIPSASTYKSLIRNCIQIGRMDDLVQLVSKMIPHYPISDELVTEIFIAITNSGHPHLVHSVKEILAKHNIPTPDLNQIRSFKRS